MKSTLAILLKTQQTLKRLIAITGGTKNNRITKRKIIYNLFRDNNTNMLPGENLTVFAEFFIKLGFFQLFQTDEKIYSNVKKLR